MTSEAGAAAAAAAEPDSGSPAQLLTSFQAALQRAMALAPTQSRTQAGKTTNSASGFVGVTRHKRTQRYEAHSWVEKKQVYLGAFDAPEQAACASDMLTLRRQRPADLNFTASAYAELQPLALALPQEELVAQLRAFSKTLGKSSAVRKPARVRIGGGSKPPATPAIAAPLASGSGAGGQPRAAGGQELPPRIVFPHGASTPISGRKPSSKRKAPTPTASVTDLESLGRVLEQRQQRQAEAAAQALASEAAAAAAPAVKKPRASQAVGRQGGEPGVAQTPAPLPPAPLRSSTPGVSLPAGSASGTSDSSAVSAWAAPPSRVQQQPSSKLRPKVPKVQRSSVLQAAAAAGRGQASAPPSFLLMPAGPPPHVVEEVQPVLLWPHTMLSVHDLLAPLRAQHGAQPAAGAPTSGPAPPLVPPALPALPASGTPAVLEAAAASVALLSPETASRTAQELASIGSALRQLAAGGGGGGT